MAAAVLPPHAGISDFVKDQIVRDVYGECRDRTVPDGLMLLLSPDRTIVLIVNFNQGLLISHHFFIDQLAENEADDGTNFDARMAMGGNVSFVGDFDFCLENQGGVPMVFNLFLQAQETGIPPTYDCLDQPGWLFLPMVDLQLPNGTRWGANKSGRLVTRLLQLNEPVTTDDPARRMFRFLNTGVYIPANDPHAGFSSAGPIDMDAGGGFRRKKMPRKSRRRKKSRTRRRSRSKYANSSLY